MNWVPLALLIALLAGLLAGDMAPPPDHEEGFAGSPLWLRWFILTDLTLVISVWAGIVNHLNVKAFPFQMLLPVSSRRLWASRVWVAYLGTLGPLVVATVAFISLSGDYYSPGFQMWLRMVMVFALLPAMVHAAGSGADRNVAKISTPKWFSAALILLATQLFIGWLKPATWLTAIGVAAATTALLFWTRARLPMQFQWRKSIESAAPTHSKASKIDNVGADVPRLLQIPIISPWAEVNRYLAPDKWIRINIYLVMAGAFNMVLSFGGDSQLILFELALIQALYLLFAMAGLPRVAFLPIPKWRIFLQGAGQGFAMVAFCLIIKAWQGSLDLSWNAVATASAASAVLMWFAAWLVVTTAVIHHFLTYPRSRIARWLGWWLKKLHVVAAFWLTLWALTGALNEQSFDVEKLHQGLADVLPQGALAWTVVIPIVAAFYWVCLRLFQRVEITQLKDRLVMAR